MTEGIRGRLIGTGFAETGLHAVPGAADAPAAVVHALDAWSERRESTLGPASSIRSITEVAVIPLLRILGFAVGRRIDGRDRTRLAAIAPSASVPVVVVGWNEPLDGAWRDVVLDGVQADSRWTFCCNGAALRIVDALQTWTRRHLEFDLALISDDDTVRRTLWSLARAEALSTRPPVLERAVEGSARQGLAVCTALGSGVLSALAVLYEALAARRTAAAEDLFEQSLTVLYRVLFLLFAEARGLVPVWHPVYRERYTIGGIVSTLLAGRPYRGIWPAVLAISRLAHAGCTAGELKVTPFNGRLFSPAQSAALDGARIPDDVMEKAVMAVGTATSPEGGRSRIHYGDLDVEQLGAVYERVLEHEPAPGGRRVLIRTRDTRRSSGTFYTPRAVTSFLVRRTLAPLVADRGADDILRLRVLDPAMGSGALLVAACRYLADTAEERLVREGRWHRGDVTPADRAKLRRQVAQRCLFGVDLNPMAVQLARLSLWLATLASDRPLTFFDHHLVVGNSLVGARLEDVLRQPTRGRVRSRRPAPVPLFHDGDMAAGMRDAIRTRLQLALDPDESPAVVARKERALAALHAPGGPVKRWSAVLDLWCAGWYWEEGSPPAAGAFAELCEHALHGRSALPEATAMPLLEHGSAVAARNRFFHWPLAFPEVFTSERGESLDTPGFDAIIGNPPWDMVRGDSGEAELRDGRRAEARRLNDFVREAGIYQAAARSHGNRYQLFVERALQLVRTGGRIGLVLPSGIVSDAGSAPLRRHLFDRAAVDSITGLDNRHRIFPIHRSLRFVLLTATAGARTTSTACRFGLTRTQDLDDSRTAPTILTRALLVRMSGGDDLGIPEIADERDLRILESITARVPWLSAPQGWGVQFGRELNATDDRHLFRPFSGDPAARPVLEGKQIEPFRAAIESCRYELPVGIAVPRVPRRPRLAYRDVASATNRLTLIAAVVPARAVTTHTLFCLRTAVPLDAQHVLCALLNSFVANYVVRFRVNTHVTASLVSRLPVPAVHERDAAFAALAGLSRALIAGTDRPEDMSEYAELQGFVCRLYGLSAPDVEHILDTFPLVAAEARENTLRLFRQPTRGC